MAAIGEDTRNWWTDKVLACLSSFSVLPLFPLFHRNPHAYAPNPVPPLLRRHHRRAFGEGFKKANWHLQLLATEPRSQRKGLASALVRRVDELVRDLDRVTRCRACRGGIVC